MSDLSEIRRELARIRRLLLVAVVLLALLLWYLITGGSDAFFLAPLFGGGMFVSWLIINGLINRFFGPKAGQ